MTQFEHRNIRIMMVATMAAAPAMSMRMCR